MSEAEQRDAAAVERVVRCALLFASGEFDRRPDDPGWQDEMYAEMLREAIVAAAATIRRREAAGGG